MIVFDVEQASELWFQARCGIPTASEFDKIITAGGKYSTQSVEYKNRLLSEIITGKPHISFKSDAMQRGNELEQEAADYYELIRGVDCEKQGFCTNDAGTYGCSVDRLIGDVGLLEIKCPLPKTMVGYMLNEDSLRKDYWVQVQGQLLVTECDWCDLLAYCPEMPPIIIRIERNTRFIMDLVAALAKFDQEMARDKKELIAKGYIKTKE